MHNYTLTVKINRRCQEPWITVERKLKQYFDVDMIRWIITAELTDEAVVIVQWTMPLDDILNRWFMEDMGGDAPFPMGSLLWWRPLDAHESITMKLGG